MQHNLLRGYEQRNYTCDLPLGTPVIQLCSLFARHIVLLVDGVISSQTEGIGCDSLPQDHYQPYLLLNSMPFGLLKVDLID